ncbi:MAG: GNAT family N-acetyltransferase [Pirellulaceae bacterium]|nr:GNAT family N-acetyltransferase [Pirellulaceae bacterium]
MAPTREIRIGNRNEYDRLAEVMFDAIRNGPSLYTEEQREAWASQIHSGDAWTQRLSDQTIFVAQEHEQIVGFMTIAAQGYIDLAYIRPHSQGTGLFRILYQELEKNARTSGKPRLRVHASLMAQPPFSAVGFEILHEESVTVGQQTLRRFKMEKHLETQ